MAVIEYKSNPLDTNKAAFDLFVCVMLQRLGGRIEIHDIDFATLEIGYDCWYDHERGMTVFRQQPKQKKIPVVKPTDMMEYD